MDWDDNDALNLDQFGETDDQTLDQFRAEVGLGLNAYIRNDGNAFDDQSNRGVGTPLFGAHANNNDGGNAFNGQSTSDAGTPLFGAHANNPDADENNDGGEDSDDDDNSVGSYSSVRSVSVNIRSVSEGETNITTKTVTLETTDVTPKPNSERKPRITQPIQKQFPVFFEGESHCDEVMTAPPEPTTPPAPLRPDYYHLPIAVPHDVHRIGASVFNDESRLQWGLKSVYRHASEVYGDNIPTTIKMLQENAYAPCVIDALLRLFVIKIRTPHNKSPKPAVYIPMAIHMHNEVYTDDLLHAFNHSSFNPPGAAGMNTYGPTTAASTTPFFVKQSTTGYALIVLNTETKAAYAVDFTLPDVEPDHIDINVVVSAVYHTKTAVEVDHITTITCNQTDLAVVCCIYVYHFLMECADIAGIAAFMKKLKYHKWAIPNYRSHFISALAHGDATHITKQGELFGRKVGPQLPKQVRERRTTTVWKYDDGEKSDHIDKKMRPTKVDAVQPADEALDAEIVSKEFLPAKQSNKKTAPINFEVIWPTQDELRTHMIDVVAKGAPQQLTGPETINKVMAEHLGCRKGIVDKIEDKSHVRYLLSSSTISLALAAMWETHNKHTFTADDIRVHIDANQRTSVFVKIPLTGLTTHVVCNLILEVYTKPRSPPTHGVGHILYTKKWADIAGCVYLQIPIAHRGSKKETPRYTLYIITGTRLRNSPQDNDEGWYTSTRLTEDMVHETWPESIRNLIARA